MPRFVLALCLAFLATAPAWAQFDSNEPPKVQAMLVSDVASIELGKPFTVALKQSIEPHWHTYWRNPGDTGLATTLNWTLPEGFAASELQWPAPQQIRNADLMTYGYEGEVMLLTTITPPTTMPMGKAEGDLITFKAKASFLVCKEICLPETAELQLSLPLKNGVPENTAAAASIEAFKAQLPQPSPTAISAQIMGQNMALTLPVANATQAYFYPYDSLLISHAGTQTLNGQTLNVPLTDARTQPIEKVDGLLELITPEGKKLFDVADALNAPAPSASISVTLPEKTAEATTTNTTSPLTFWVALGLAFVAGLILNLMPCVLPVLSIKALSLLNKAHGTDRQQARWSGIAYTIGVLVSFAVLAVVLLGLKATGQSIGWGVQLQSPYFVAAMACLMFVLGLMFVGTLTIGQSLMGVGQNLTQKSGFWGSFFTGVLAVVVATPCTAPFMGGAVFYALSQPAVVAVAVLLSLGFGLALPYLLLSFFPQTLRFLPKPGAWMETFKQVLAFPMFAAAIWLVWVLAQQAGANAVGRVLLAMLAISFTAFIWSKATYASATKRLWLIMLATLTLGFGLLALRGIEKQMVAPQTTAAYEAFSPQKLADLQAQGKPVFVNMTAAWCITCLANEKAALSTATVQNFFKAQNITYLKGDWTNYDTDITAFLQKFGRNGVPLYVFYPADSNKAPIILPQLLTPQTVIQSIQPQL